MIYRKDSSRKSLVLYNQISHELALINDPGEFLKYDNRLVSYDPSSVSSNSITTSSNQTLNLFSSQQVLPSDSLISPVHRNATQIFPNGNQNLSLQPGTHNLNPLHHHAYICQECGAILSDPNRVHNNSNGSHNSNNISTSPEAQMSTELTSRMRLLPPNALEAPVVRDANYFKLLEGFTPIHPGSNSASTSTTHTTNGNETDTNSSTNNSEEPNPPGSGFQNYYSISENAISQGYFDKFFKLKRKLGQGSRGAVYLVEHVLDGYSLGLFALKKVPVGDDHKWLQKVLEEVHLLRLLSHPNLVSYNHMWLENSHISRFAPVVPCAFILQEYCDGGTLEDYVNNLQAEVIQAHSIGSNAGIKAKRRRERFRRQSESRSTSSVSPEDILKKAYLTPEEVLTFARDVFAGVSHLHQAQVIHRDLKPSNCLLLTSGKHRMSHGNASHHKSEGSSRTLPTVLVSDFGEGQLEGILRTGTGTTGTLEYCAPELITPGKDGQFVQFSKKTDMFSLGMILHYLCFSRLPYSPRLVDGVDAESLNKLHHEVIQFAGFDINNIEPRSDLPTEIYSLLARLLSTNPQERPSAKESLETIDRLLQDYRLQKFNSKNDLHGSTPISQYNDTSRTRPIAAVLDSKKTASDSSSLSSGEKSTEESSSEEEAADLHRHAQIRLISDSSIEDAKQVQNTSAIVKRTFRPLELTDGTSDADFDSSVEQEKNNNLLTSSYRNTQPPQNNNIIGYSTPTRSSSSVQPFSLSPEALRDQMLDEVETIPNKIKLNGSKNKKKRDIFTPHSRNNWIQRVTKKGRSSYGNNISNYKKRWMMLISIKTVLFLTKLYMLSSHSPNDTDTFQSISKENSQLESSGFDSTNVPNEKGFVDQVLPEQDHGSFDEEEYLDSLLHPYDNNNPQQVQRKDNNEGNTPHTIKDGNIFTTVATEISNIIFTVWQTVGDIFSLVMAWLWTVTESLGVKKFLSVPGELGGTGLVTRIGNQIHSIMETLLSSQNLQNLIILLMGVELPM